MKPLFAKIFSKPLPLSVQEIIYATADTYFSGARALLDIFYAYFLSQVLGLSVATAGAIYAVALLCRGLAEPIAGLISDQWDTPWGKRKPFFVMGIPGIFISFLLLWYPFSGTLADKTLIAWIAAITYGLVSGGLMTPYAAMGPDLVTDYHGRTRLSNLRHLFQLIALIITILAFSYYFISGQTSSPIYTLLVWLFAFLFSIPFIMLILFIPEKTHNYEKESWKHIFKKIRQPFQSKDFCYFLVMNTMMETTMILLPALFPFYLKFYLERLDLLPLYACALALGAFGALYLMMTRYKKTCKVMLYKSGALVLAAMLCVMVVITPKNNFLLFPVFILVGIAVALTSSARLSMLSDLADYISQKQNSHMQAIVYALAKCVAMLFSSMMIFLIFQMTHLEHGSTFGLESMPSETAISGVMIKWLLIAPIAVLMAIAGWAAVHYKLSAASK